MTKRPLQLVDPSSDKVADLDVKLVGELYRGTIDLGSTPPQLRRLFEQFEELVEGQMFNLADEIEGKIAAHSLRTIFANGTQELVEELQVFPSTKRVSFKTRDLVTAAATPIRGPGDVSQEQIVRQSDMR